MADTSKELKPRTILRDLPRKGQEQPAELTEQEAEAVKGGLISVGDDGDPDEGPFLP
jgi:hypothetical protein